MTSFRYVRWGALAIGFLVNMRVAAADPAAEKLFRDGRALLQENKLAEACAAFERSDAIEPRIGTVLNLADCREPPSGSAFRSS